MPVATSVHVPWPWQHGVVALHAWPSCAHVRVMPHVPSVWPGWNTQVMPLQQSAVAVHAPPVARTVAPQRSTPFASGTHGSAVAAVADERAGLRRPSAHRAEAVAARHAERVELAHAGVARGAAAVVARRRVAARVVLVVADVALGVAAHRVAADAGRIGRVRLDRR